MRHFELPARHVERPRTGDYIPHLQLSDTSPPELVSQLMEWAVASLPDVREEPTRISVSTTRALRLDESFPATHGDSFMPPPGGREFGNVHADGSMHLCISDEAVYETVEKRWGEPHPLKDQGVNEVLCYTSRNDEELETVRIAFVES